MNYLLLGLLIVIGLANIVMLAVMFNRRSDQAGNEDKLGRIMREEMATNRTELSNTMTNIANLQKNQLETFSSQLTVLTGMNERKLDTIRSAVDEKLTSLQNENSKKLEEMRVTVDEKLHSTLEKRLGESFKMVNDRLESVYKGLGEMQNLASGVGDLKKVLSNVKTRGTWGEVQLGTLLEQMLTAEQYEKNVALKKGSGERVEFAIKLPGGSDGKPVWLPIDAKFPLEDYQRLVEAQEKVDLEGIEAASKALVTRIKSEAKDIKEKYLNPPYTTDFGILFLPVEGLYAEILSIAGLSDSLQRDYRVTITGPTTIAAFLNSLQMGFRTLAIEKRASEVWVLLETVKAEFGKFGDILDKTQKKLEEASHTIEDAAKKSRTIESKLRRVEELPVNTASDVAMIPKKNIASEQTILI